MRRKAFILIVICGGVVSLDQITKFMVQDRFVLHESVLVLDGFFSLTYILNPGAAFGFLADQNETFRTVFFLSVSVIALTLLLVFYRDTPADDTLGLCAIALLFGGAIGNLIDRIRIGEVVDFLDFYIARHHWPAFNVADSAITIGISLMLYHLIFIKKEMTEQKSEMNK